MPQIGGSVLSISFNGRQFSVPADADLALKLGGFENEMQASGSGITRMIKTRVPFSITGVVVGIDDTLQDHEFLQDLANSKEFADCVVELASGALWTGQAQISGELTRSSQTTTSPFDVAGSLKLVQQ